MQLLVVLLSIDSDIGVKLLLLITAKQCLVFKLYKDVLILID